MKEDFKEGNHTTKAYETFQEHKNIRAILTSIDKLKTKQQNKNRTPQAIDDLLKLNTDLIQIIRKAQ